MTLTPPTSATTPASGTRIEANGTPCAAASEIWALEKCPTALATKISANSARPTGTKPRMDPDGATDVPRGCTPRRRPAAHRRRRRSSRADVNVLLARERERAAIGGHPGILLAVAVAADRKLGDLRRRRPRVGRR